ncbi:hypothetical protein, partial [Bacteroides mediterraneensis]|uniref:hypothetical protein n=1 Tax=Bacteroides mediterraneensis TaxID=1841856 RepID=UPI00195AACAE
KRKPVFRPSIPRKFPILSRKTRQNPLETRRARLQIPPNLSISRPSHLLQKPSEKGTLPKIAIKSPRKQNQKDTQITTQAAKRNQTTQIEINPEIGYKAPDSPRSSPLFFPLPILQNARKSLLVP